MLFNGLSEVQITQIPESNCSARAGLALHVDLENIYCLCFALQIIPRTRPLNNGEFRPSPYKAPIPGIRWGISRDTPGTPGIPPMWRASDVSWRLYGYVNHLWRIRFLPISRKRLNRKRWVLSSGFSTIGYSNNNRSPAICRIYAWLTRGVHRKKERFSCPWVVRLYNQSAALMRRAIVLAAQFLLLFIKSFL